MDTIAHHLQQLILDAGYLGLFALIVLESTAVPVPSLLVMPFAGFMASRGHFSLPAILAINSAGALTGSLLSYWFGAAGGRKLLLRYGKWLLIKPEDLDKADAYFEKHGARTVFIARFLPVVRHVISIPAGIARMRLDKFLGLTFLGATIWGGGLMILGYELGSNWESVIRTWKKIDLFVGVAFVIAAIIVTVRFVRSRRARAATLSHTPAPVADAVDPKAGT
jgi:membrane protein DedA with SNARE-associated domain